MSVLVLAERLWLFFAGGEDRTRTVSELERVRARDPEALGAFFDRHFPRVYSLAARLLGRREEAEDLAQEVFYRAYGAIERLDAGKDPVPWLMTITYNACRDLWRSLPARTARRTVSLDAEPGDLGGLADPAPGPEEQRLTREKEAAVQAALLQLGESSRIAVLLHDYQGMTHEEIAETLAISPAAARKRYSRALGEMGDLLARVTR